MTEGKAVYRFESWLERQVDREDEVGQYARRCSGQGSGERNGAYLSLSDAAHQAHDEFYEYVGALPVQGASGEWRLSDMVDKGRDGAAVIADVDDPMKINSILCLKPKKRYTDVTEHVAMFGTEGLADVYLYRLRKKKLVPDSFRVVRVPEDKTDRAVFLTRTGKAGIAFCYCDSRREFQKAYNAIDNRRDGLEAHVYDLLRDVDTAYLHDLGPQYPDDCYSPYDRSKQVEWVVSKVTQSEAAVRARMGEERQEIIEKRINSFLSGLGTWVDVEDVYDLAFVVDLLDTDRELYEARYLVDDEGHTGSLFYARARDYTTRRTVDDLLRVTGKLEADLGGRTPMAVDSLEELAESFRGRSIKQVRVTERHAVRYLRGGSPVRTIR